MGWVDGVGYDTYLTLLWILYEMDWVHMVGYVRNATLDILLVLENVNRNYAS